MGAKTAFAIIAMATAFGAAFTNLHEDEFSKTASAHANNLDNGEKSPPAEDELNKLKGRCKVDPATGDILLENLVNRDGQGNLILLPAFYLATTKSIPGADRPLVYSYRTGEVMPGWDIKRQSSTRGNGDNCYLVSTSWDLSNTKIRTSPFRYENEQSLHEKFADGHRSLPTLLVLHQAEEAAISRKYRTYFSQWPMDEDVVLDDVISTPAAHTNNDDVAADTTTHPHQDREDEQKPTKQWYEREELSLTRQEIAFTP